MSTPSDMEHILERVMTRLDENDRRYGAALDGLQSRLSHVSARAGEARAKVDPAAKAALERVESQAAMLSREAKQPASQPPPAQDNDAFRALEERISDFALRSGDREPETRRPQPAPSGSRAATPPPIRPAASRPPMDRPAPDLPAGEKPFIDRPGAGSAGDMFSGAAARLEQSLSASPPSAGLEAINRRMDELARRLDDALAQRPDAASIQRIESQLSEIVPHFSILQDQHRRLEAVEQHLHGLVEWLRTSGSQMEHVARQAAEEAVRQMPAPAPSNGNERRLDSIEYELRALNERAERMDERTVRTLEAMTQSMHLLAQKLEEPVATGQMQREGGQDWMEAARGGAGDTAEVHISQAAGLREPAGPRHGEPEDLDALGASIPDFQPPPGPRRGAGAGAAEPRMDPAPAQGTAAADDEEDFIAAARRAARSAAARAAPEPRTGSFFRRHRQPPAYAAEPAAPDYERRQRPRPIFVITAVLLLSASAYLFYERLKSKPDVPPVSAPQQTLPAPAPEPKPEPQPLPQKSSEALIPRISPPAGGEEAGRLARAFETPAQLERPQPAATQRPPEAPSLESLGIAGSVIDRKAFQAPENSRIAAEMFGAAVPDAPSKPKAPETTDERLPGAVVRIEEPERAPAAGATAPAARRVAAATAPARGDATTGTPAGSLPPATIGPDSLRLAAARGNAAAQYEIGARYAKGSGVPVDMERAAQWFSRAAAQGLAPAQFRLASLYERGQGVEADAGKAKAWYERAAQQGHVKAMHNLGVMLSGGDRSSAAYTSAAAWFQRAAQLGLTDSQFNLGILYETGLGVQKNAAEAYRWFSTAAARGDREAEKRREQVRTQLSAKMLQQLDQFLAQWRPDRPDTAANEVRPPEGGWSAAAAGQSDTEAGTDLVASAQKLLNTLGYDAGVPDGVLGPQTISAIRRFETRSGLPGSGTVTPELLARLKALSS